METLRKYINTISPISDESWKEFKEILFTKKFSAGDVLCKYNCYPSKIYYSKKGYGRAFAIDNAGNEFNMILYPPNRFMGSLSALTQKSRSNLEVQCLTDCEIICFNYQDLIKLVKKNNEFSRFYRKALEYYLLKLEKSNIRYVTLNATERYRLLKIEAPNIEKFVPQYHIASHLGITPIQLSRIRKKMLNIKKK